jgi:radical SAM protein with 4Fe4S-binding SPASM domain
MEVQKPKTAWLTVNRSCNLRCQWCYGMSSGFEYSLNIEYETAKKIVLLLKEIGIKTIVIIGGEPTIWKNLFSLNDLCNELSLRTSIITNAYAFHSEKFWLNYLKHPNTRIEISLKAFDEESSLLVTGNRRYFENVKVGIEKIVSKFKTPINIVYSNLVENNLLRMVTTAVYLGASYVDVCICKPILENKKFTAPFTVNFEKMAEEISSNFDQMIDITKGALSFTLNTPLCIWPADFIQKSIQQKRIGKGCQFQHRSGIVFDTDGSALLCNSMLNCSVGKYGVDFIDSDSLIELFNSDKVNRIYSYVNSYPSEKCIDCELYQNCRGGCPLMWTVFDPNKIVQPRRMSS